MGTTGWVWLDETLPEPWMRGATVLALTLVVAAIARWVLGRLIGQLVSRTAGDADDRIVAAVGRPIFLTILLWGICAAEMASGLPERVRVLSVQLTQTILLVVWVVTLSKVVRIILESLRRRKARPLIDSRMFPLLENVARILFVVAAAYGFLRIWNLDITPWLASAGIVGLALGFAAKDTLANLFGGFFVIVDAPYKIGDFVNLDTGERGEVTKIGLRSTRLLTRDDIEITIPNAQIAAAKIINEAGGKWEKSRIRVPVGVAYGSNVAEVRQVLMDAAAKVDLVLDEPEPRVRFRALGESSLDFELLGWIEEPWQRGQAVDKVLTEIYEGLGRAGITIPFPQRDLHVHGPIRVVGVDADSE